MSQQLTPFSQTPIYIFDLDGTLALNDHRQHYISAKAREDLPDWHAFYAACIHDSPNWPVIGTFLQLYACGCDCRIWSGRSDEVYEQTLEWLGVYLSMKRESLIKILLMRPADDFRPDDHLKLKWLNEMNPKERSRLAAVFDDRDKVVDMWRREGVACFQVARGNF